MRPLRSWKVFTRDGHHRTLSLKPSLSKIQRGNLLSSPPNSPPPSPPPPPPPPRYTRSTSCVSHPLAANPIGGGSALRREDSIAIRLSCTRARVCVSVYARVRTRPIKNRGRKSERPRKHTPGKRVHFVGGGEGEMVCVSRRGFSAVWVCEGGHGGYVKWWWPDDKGAWNMRVDRVCWG